MIKFENCFVGFREPWTDCDWWNLIFLEYSLFAAIWHGFCVTVWNSAKGRFLFAQTQAVCNEKAAYIPERSLGTPLVSHPRYVSSESEFMISGSIPLSTMPGVARLRYPNGLTNRLNKTSYASTVCGYWKEPASLSATGALLFNRREPVQVLLGSLRSLLRLSSPTMGIGCNIIMILGYLSKYQNVSHRATEHMPME